MIQKLERIQIFGPRSELVVSPSLTFSLKMLKNEKNYKVKKSVLFKKIKLVFDRTFQMLVI